MSSSITVNYTVSCTAVPGSQYSTLPASVIIAANQTSTNLLVQPTGAVTTAQTVVLTLGGSTNYYLGAYSQATVTLLPGSSLTNSVPSI